MRTPLGTTILVSIMILLDFYVFSALETVSVYASPQTQTIIYSLYWTVAILAIIGLVLFVFTDAHFMAKKIRTYLFATILAFFFAQIVASAFFLVDDVRRILQWGFQKAFAQQTTGGSVIFRSQILSWAGLAAGAALFTSLVLGFTNKYNYRIKRIRLAFKNLPEAFNGFKIVHFSDVHSGSFMNKKAVEEGVQKILDQKADLIIFSGDLVNDRASEMENYMDVFSKIKAPNGVYSTLGNHDYGDYVRWPYHGVSREENLEHLKQVHKQLGWRLMMNEHETIKKGNDEIALIGIENWSAKARFPKHGDMKKAYAGTENFPFKILISHDPSHWETEVVTEYPDIDLTLSGHTHGMQFGIEIGNFKWSPVQYMYKKWKGLYEHGNQKLYINPGFGFIGYPGRVGIMPEITVIELVKA